MGRKPPLSNGCERPEADSRIGIDRSVLLLAVEVLRYEIHSTDVEYVEYQAGELS